MDQARAQGCYSEETLRFMEKILANSGLGEETCMPPGFGPASHSYRNEVKFILSLIH
jgi:hypothetical protein